MFFGFRMILQSLGMQSDFQPPYFFVPRLATGERVPSGKQGGVGWLIETALPPGEAISWGRLATTIAISLEKKCFIPEMWLCEPHTHLLTRIYRCGKLDQSDNVKKEKLQHIMVRCMIMFLEASSIFTAYPHSSILSTFVNLIVWLVAE